MLHLQGTARRAPFSDWMSITDRLIERRTGMFHRSPALARSLWEGYYNCGLSPSEAVSDWLSEG